MYTTLLQRNYMNTPSKQENNKDQPNQESPDLELTIEEEELLKKKLEELRKMDPFIYR